ncbi:hypothetical protein BN133_1792 [Cronobacter dublinensis 582]|nr:hypothetical protein BN133_1792 [Cronobacter dublinensis 582]
MNDRTRRFALTVIIALALLLTLMLWSLCQGAVPLDWRDVAGALRLAPWPVSDITATIVTQLIYRAHRRGPCHDGRAAANHQPQ